MRRLLIKYAKEGRLRFLSHLEVIKSLERGLRRTALSLVITEGFHPHPKLSFGPALAVGVGSSCEYALAFLEKEAALDETKVSLSRELPAGMPLLDAVYIPEGAPPIGRLIRAAAYEVRVEIDGLPDERELADSIAWLSSIEELVVEKEGACRKIERSQAVLGAAGKVGERSVDFNFLLSTGGASGVKPARLAFILLEKAGKRPADANLQINRTGLFALIDGQPVDIMRYYKEWTADAEDGSSFYGPEGETVESKGRRP